MRCMICGQNVNEAGALFRVNDKGKPGVWSCKPHYASARAHFPDGDPSAPDPMPAALLSSAPEQEDGSKDLGAHPRVFPRTSQSIEG